MEEEGVCRRLCRVCLEESCMLWGQGNTDPTMPTARERDQSGVPCNQMAWLCSPFPATTPST